MGKLIKNLVLTFYMFIFLLCSSILFVVNCTPIYSLGINIFNIEKLAGFSKELLLKDYKRVVEYLRSPFIKELKLDNFIMSPQGEYHFFEVKNIILIVELIFLICLIIGIILIILNKKKKLRLTLKPLNYLFNLTFIGVSALIISFYFDFTTVFNKFHEIIFNNDYWIFDYRVDPIIMALPEGYFMLCGVICLLFILLIATIGKIYSVKKSRKF